MHKTQWGNISHNKDIMKQHETKMRKNEKKWEKMRKNKIGVQKVNEKKSEKWEKVRKNEKK